MVRSGALAQFFREIVRDVFDRQVYTHCGTLRAVPLWHHIRTSCLESVNKQVKMTEGLNFNQLMSFLSAG
jgi:hypothetical protein